MRAAWVLVAGVALFGCTAPPGRSPSEGVQETGRRSALRKASVWRPVDTARLDVRRGPEGSRVPEAPLECSFVLPSSPMGGNTPKFPCRGASGEILKVKYGSGNMEVQGEIFGSRLLWLLGFYTDRIDPVRVRCRGCPEDPWDFLQGFDIADPRPAPPTGSTREFHPAIVETYFGERIQARPGQGLPWNEILEELSEDDERAGVQRIHREALTLLAAFLAHGDSKPGNQTLACAPGGGTPARCTRPVVYIGDLGAILGRGWRVVTSKADIEGWSGIPIWRDPATCLARFNTHPAGTLFDTPISEPARAFLAKRLSALSDAQIRDLFVVAGLDGVGGELEGQDGEAHPPSADDWAAVFRDRRRQITDHTCP